MKHPLTKTYQDHNPVWSIFLFLLVVVVIGARYTMPLRDADIWYHLLYGKYHLENLTLIADHTLFSWTPTTNEYIYCVWLSDIILYLLHKIGGLPVLIVLRYICIYFLVLCCFLFAYKKNQANHPLTWLACLISSQMAYGVIVIKPELFSFIFIILYAWNWWYIREENENAWRNCYYFPLIMIIWVNSHGVFFLGIAFLSLAIAGEFLNARFSRKNSLSFLLKKHLIAAYLLTLISMFITPYGFDYIQQFFTTVTPTKANIDIYSPFLAYQSAFTTGGSFGFVLLFFLGIILLLYLFFLNPKKVEWSLLLTNLFFIFLYVKMTRTIFFWAPIFLFSIISLLPKKTTPGIFNNAKISRNLLAILSVIIAIYISFFTIRQSLVRPEQYVWMGFGIPSVNPVSEARYIKNHFPTARIGNTYNQGAYLIWELWPNNKVLIDQRFFPYKNWVQEYWNTFLYTNQDNYSTIISKFVDHYKCDVWCIGIETIIAAQWFFISPGWKLAYYGKSSAVFVKNDIPLTHTTVKVSTNINEIKNFQSAVDVLKWTLVIKDWSTAETTLSLMENNFSSYDQRESSRKLTNLTHNLRDKNQSLMFLPDKTKQ